MLNGCINAGSVPVINCSQDAFSYGRRDLPLVVFNAMYPYLINTERACDGLININYKWLCFINICQWMASG